jgi:hypothetical protein
VLSFDAGTRPTSVVVADFTGTGIPDLAVADSGDFNTNTGAGVSILLGNGDGSFRPAHTFAAGVHPVSVAVGDFNGDGVPDLAVTPRYDGEVSVLLGNGDGSFGPARLFPIGDDSESVAVGDFNGDGIPDLAVVDVGDGHGHGIGLSVLLGNGDGSFQRPVSYSAGPNPVSVAVGDFNGDGIPDLVVADALVGLHDTYVYVLLGHGDGSFQPAQSFPAGTYARSVAVGDFNGEGIQDLAVVSYPSMVVLLGNGNGTFQFPRTFPAGNNPESVAVGDFNGDGVPDLAVVNFGTSPNYTDSSVSVLMGHGDGSFQPAQTFAAGGRPFSVAVGDFNGDGFPDLAVLGAGGARSCWATGTAPSRRTPSATSPGKARGAPWRWPTSTGTANPTWSWRILSPTTCRSCSTTGRLAGRPPSRPGPSPGRCWPGSPDRAGRSLGRRRAEGWRAYPRRHSGADARAGVGPAGGN